MVTKDLEITITIPFPVGVPDENGYIYSKEAVEKAINSLRKNRPITVRVNGKCIVLGHTVGDYPTAVWDDKNNVYKVTVNGILDRGGTECNVNKMEGLEIQDFDILRFGFSTKGDD